MTTVTIVIPCFNSEEFIEDTINSVFIQEIEDIEIIVVDDGSSDSTTKIVSRFPSVRLLQQEHVGACRARNKGIKEARGKWIKFLDSDDLLVKGALARQLNFASAQDLNVVTYWDIEYFNNETGGRKFVNSELPQLTDPVLALLKKNIQTSCPLHRRSALLSIGGFDERFLSGQEYELHIRLALNNFRFLHFPLLGSLIREHSSPYRISNRREKPEVVANGQLRGAIIQKNIRNVNDGVLPEAIQVHFCKGAFDRFFLAARKFDFQGCKQAFLTITEVNPSLKLFGVELYRSSAGFARRAARHILRKVFRLFGI